MAADAPAVKPIWSALPCRAVERGRSLRPGDRFFVGGGNLAAPLLAYLAQAACTNSGQGPASLVARRDGLHQIENLLANFRIFDRRESAVELQALVGRQKVDDVGIAIGLGESRRP